MTHEQSQPTQGEALATPDTQQEVIQYSDGQLALEIAGEAGAVFDWSKHKYSPTDYPGNEAIVLTESGNGYYIVQLYRGDKRIPIIVNMGRTAKSGRLVASERDSYTQSLPPVEFHKPWSIPNFFDTTAIQKVMLKYKKVPSNYDEPGARKMDLPDNQAPNPFEQYKSVLKQYGLTEEPQHET